MRSIALALCTLTLAAPALAGPLDPPIGPVTSTGKTLTEVEPRTPINAANTPGDSDATPSLFKITQPGSYYLMGNVTGVINKSGIEVAASNVTIDLNGFELVGVTGTASVHGVYATGTGLTNITVRNGSVRNWGGYGVNLSPTLVSRGEVRAIRSDNNATGGFFLHSYFNVTDCSAASNNGVGFFAVNSCNFSRCTASGNAGNGFATSGGHTLTECVSYGSTGGGGFQCGTETTMRDCSSHNNAGVGVFVGTGSTVSGCTVRTNEGVGIAASGATFIHHNSCTANGLGSNGAGISISGANARVENNHCAENARGIETNSSRSRIDGNSCVSNGVSFVINGTDNLVIRNTASGGTPNYSIAAGNSVAPRVSVEDSDGWAGITNANHPWANFGH